MQSNRQVAAAASLALALVAFAFATAAGASSREEQSFLSLYFSDEELEIVSATRSLKSAASVAENVTTVTAEEIELTNAHTVAEALYNVTGVEMLDYKGPGSEAAPTIHASRSDRVTVMLDGVPLNSANNAFQLATLPVQMVAKIEVIKGPASSTWGSSFGGVVNVITKSPDARGSRAGGTLSVSAGERGTSDLRAEARAGGDGAGFYVFAGRMDSDGLRAGHWFTHENLFAKASLDAGHAARLDVAGFYHRSDSLNADFGEIGVDVSNAFALETLYGKADLTASLPRDVELRLSAWRLRNNDNFYEERPSTGERIRDAPVLFDRHGFSGSLARRAGRHALVAGADWTHERFEREFAPFDAVDQGSYALFVNDTVAAGRFSVTPGLRYDHASLAGGMASPSLGATWLASRDLLFRGVVSRGFHDPAILRYLDAPARRYFASRTMRPETIWSYQAGVEANVAGVLRTKLTLFYHDVDDILVEKRFGEGTFTVANQGRARTAGGEVEVATNTFAGFVFKGGAHYEDTDLRDAGERLVSDVREVYGVNAALSYGGGKGLRGAVKAHYVWWDLADGTPDHARGVVVDVDLTARLLTAGRTAVDLFAGASNVFNAHSYTDVLQRNPDRWLEAGVRASF